MGCVMLFPGESGIFFQKLGEGMAEFNFMVVLNM